MHLGAEAAHLVALVGGGKPGGLSVEGLDFLGDREVLLGDGPVGDACVDHGHGEGLVAEEGGDGLQGHAAVDGLGGQGVAELMSGDVADPGRVGDLGQGLVDMAGAAYDAHAVSTVQKGWRGSRPQPRQAVPSAMSAASFRRTSSNRRRCS